MTAAVEVLPWLPQGWLDGIAAGDYVERARGEVGSAKKAWSWIRKRPEAKGDPCAIMGSALTAGLEQLPTGSAHDELTARTYQLIALGAEGHRGAYTAVLAFAREFVREVSGNRRADAASGRETGSIRSPEEARREVGRAVLGAVKLILGHLQQPEMVEAGLSDGASGCSCWDEPTIRMADGTEAPASPGSARDPYSYPMTETGNAEQLADLSNGDLVWVPADKTWFGYDESSCRWHRDDFLGMAWARRLAPRVLAAAEQRFRAAEGLDATVSGNSAHSDAEIALIQGKKLMGWAEKCGSRANMANTLEVMKSLPGAVVGAERFDGDGTLLGVGAGEVLHFSDDGLVVRKAERQDYLTQSTQVPYVPGATDSLWSNYLETFVPDAAVRGYLQRLLGYSLLGGNPQRLLVFLHGPTSSGKSTLVEAVGAAVGDYGGPIGLSVFREKQDDAPRPDLLRALRLRFAFASEAGSEWYLHADQIKRLTGGDSISARGMHANVMQNIVPRFTPFVATNAVPRIPGADAALWKRLVVVPFDLQISKRADDATARDRLRESPATRAAVLAWLVSGWEAYRAEGLGQMPQVMRRRLQDFKGGVSEFHAWFEDTLELDRNSYVPVADLYQAYKVSMMSDGVDKPLSSHNFGLALTSQGVQPSKGKKLDGKVVKVRYGVRFKRSD